MKMEEILIKNMVCPRCVMAVEGALQNLKIDFEKVVLGRVVLKKDIDGGTKSEFEKSITKLGFEVLKDRDIQRIEKIKTLLHALFQEEEIPSGFNLMSYIKEHIPEDYSTLSHLFSSLEGITIEKFFIQKKIEKVKEWLFYEEMNLNEMSWKLDYSSVQHLSTQFKKITGMTPSEHKKLKYNKSTGWKNPKD